jgi:hypothetical protein
MVGRDINRAVEIEASGKRRLEALWLALYVPHVVLNPIVF